MAPLHCARPTDEAVKLDALRRDLDTRQAEMLRTQVDQFMVQMRNM